jgi:hypothetical protein
MDGLFKSLQKGLNMKEEDCKESKEIITMVRAIHKLHFSDTNPIEKSTLKDRFKAEILIKEGRRLRK